MTKKTLEPPKHNHVLPDPHPPWAEPSRSDYERYWESVSATNPPKPERQNPPDLGDDFRKGTGPSSRKRGPDRGR